MESKLVTIDPRREAASAIAMTLTLISFGMLFMALMLGYAILRSNSTVWPPMGMERAHMFYPVLSSSLMALSSLTYMTFENDLRRRRGRNFFLHATLILGVGFLVSQGFFWQNLKSSGLYVSAGIFPSFLYGLTWIHGGHLCLALLFLGLLIWGRKKFKEEQTELLWVQNVGQFWHFLGVVWFILYLSVFVL